MYHFINVLLQPFVLLYLLVAILLIAVWRKRREQRRLIAAPIAAFAALYLFSTPLAGYLALGSLEWTQPPPQPREDDVQAIVVLAGYVRSANAVRPRPELGTDTLYRCLEGARLYHESRPCPVLVSGGTVEGDGGLACAPLMRDFLVRLGVPSQEVIVEDRSGTTWENAVESNKLLEPRGIHKVMLVTDATHLFRAVRCFRRQGLEVVPHGCRYRASSWRLEMASFLPGPSGAGGVQDAWHEWLGSAWYCLRGRF